MSLGDPRNAWAKNWLVPAPMLFWMKLNTSGCHHPQYKQLLFSKFFSRKVVHVSLVKNVAEPRPINIAGVMLLVMILSKYDLWDA